jgi:hypothetical protein
MSETAERKIPVELTEAEIHAVIKFHVAATKRIPKALGQAVLEERANSLFPRARYVKALHEEAQAAMAGHVDRAQRLLDILKQQTPTKNQK